MEKYSEFAEEYRSINSIPLDDKWQSGGPGCPYEEEPRPDRALPREGPDTEPEGDD